MLEGRGRTSQERKTSLPRNKAKQTHGLVGNATARLSAILPRNTAQTGPDKDPTQRPFSSFVHNAYIYVPMQPALVKTLSKVSLATRHAQATEPRHQAVLHLV